MPNPLRIEISESENTLKRLLRHQSSGRRKEHLQVLHWLKSGQVNHPHGVSKSDRARKRF